MAAHNKCPVFPLDSPDYKKQRLQFPHATREMTERNQAKPNSP